MTQKPTYEELEERIRLLERATGARGAGENPVPQQVLEGIFHAVPVRVFWKDRNLVYLGCNDAFACDAGFAVAADIVGKNDFDMVWHDQADLYRSDDRAVIESGTPRLLIEEPQTAPDGTILTLLTSKVPLRNAAGEVVGVLGTYFDISERKRVEAALAEERERAAAAMEDVKTLRGIVPICANCKKVRDDEGYWSQVEQYVSEHSEAEFSHGICPDCMAKLYPGFSRDK